MKEILNKISCCDCLAGFKLLPDSSIDCIWTDPPYNINYHYEEYDDARPQDDYLELMDAVFKESHRVLKDGKVMFMKQWYNNLPAILNIGSKYFTLHNLIIWKNSSPAQPKDNYKPVYEVILMFTKGKINYFNDKFETRKTIMPWNKGRIVNYYGKLTNLWDDIPNVYAGSIKHKEGVYKPGTNEKEHPAQHPIKLVTRCIGFVTKENEIVLDPFIGSGTTAIACKQLNRKFIGFEISEKYCDVAEKRLQQTVLSDVKLK